jgi:tripartite-type tricarboxylate transporter receptor subunit TctC
LPREAAVLGRVKLAALLALTVAGASAFAQETWPNRPIRMVVAYPPGGAVDIMARSVAQKLQESLGQPVPVDNRAGGSGVIGAQAVASAPADGYTMLVVDRGALTINPSLYRSPPYDPTKDFAYTGVSTELHYVLAINASLPVSSLQEFVRLAQSKPGAINYGSFGIGTITQLNFEQLAAHFGIRLTHVPYKGAAQTSIGVLNGEVAIMMSSVAGVASFLKDGRLRALAVTGPKRSPQMPEVPTLREAGGGDTVVPTYFTYALPSGTPRAVVARLSTELARAQQASDVLERLTKAGLEPQVVAPEAFADEVRRDLARFRTLIAKLDLPLQ